MKMSHLEVQEGANNIWYITPTSEYDMARNKAVPCKKMHFQAWAKKRQTVPHVPDVTSLLQRRATVALLFRRHDVVTSQGL